MSIFKNNKVDLKKYNYPANITFKEKLSAEELKIAEKVQNLNFFFNFFS